MLAFVRIMLISVLVISSVAAPRRKEINIEKLEEDFFDESEEDYDWHEDGIEYEDRKQAKMLKTKSMTERLAFRSRPGDASEKGRIQGTFVYLKDGSCKNEMCAIDVAQKFVSLLQTGGVTTSAYPVDNNQLLFTNMDGKWNQMREFLLQQSEVKRLHWDGKDFWAPGVEPDPANAGDSLIPDHLKVQDRKEAMRNQMKAMGMEQDENGAWVKAISPDIKTRRKRKKKKKRRKRKTRKRRGKAKSKKLGDGSITDL